jgi:hypothetical protein
LGCFNLTMHGHASCVQFLRKQNVPLILLGGGGYTVKNVARTWTYETACALGIENEIDPVLPWNQYFEWFGPRYRLEVPENNMEDLNVKDGSLDAVRCVVFQILHSLRSYSPEPMRYSSSQNWSTLLLFKSRILHGRASNSTSDSVGTKKKGGTS